MATLHKNQDWEFYWNPFHDLFLLQSLEDKPLARKLQVPSSYWMYSVDTTGIEMEVTSLFWVVVYMINSTILMSHKTCEKEYKVWKKVVKGKCKYYLWTIYLILERLLIYKTLASKYILHLCSAVSMKERYLIFVFNHIFTILLTFSCFRPIFCQVRSGKTH